ncbi:MAG: Outer membrane protein assembly factor BamB [Holosporales bacterium]
MNRTTKVCGLCALVLAGCEADKPHLEGERISFLSTPSSGILVKKDVVLDKEHVYTDWPQVGGNAQHNTWPTQLKKQIKSTFQTSVGEGTSCGRLYMPNVVTSNDTIYTMDAKGKVTASDFNGKTRFSIETVPEDHLDMTLGGGLALSNNVLVVSSSIGQVLAYNAKTGKALWKENLPAPSRVAPTIEKNVVLVTTINNETHAFDLTNGQKKWQHQGLQEASALLGGASPAVQDKIAILCYSSGEYYAVDMESGQAVWTDTLTSALRKDTVSSIAHIKANPIIEKDKVYVISHGGRIVANDLKSGVRLWQKDYASAQNMAIGGDFLFFVTLENELVAIERTTGDLKWKTYLGDLIEKTNKVLSFTAPILVNGQLITIANTGDLLFIDAKKGKLSNTLKLGAAVMQPPVVVQKKMIILDDNANLTLYQ